MNKQGLRSWDYKGGQPEQKQVGDRGSGPQLFGSYLDIEGQVFFFLIITSVFFVGFSALLKDQRRDHAFALWKTWVPCLSYLG